MDKSMMMKGNWKQMQAQLKQHWCKLTDHDISQINGNYAELEGRLARAYGYQKDQVRREIQTFFDKYNWTEKCE